MSDAERLADLRDLFLRAPESATVQLVAIATSLGLAGIVLWLVRRRTIRAEYTPIWMGVAFALLVVSIDLDVLRVLTRLLGAWTMSSTIFFLGQFFLLAISLNYAVRLSQTGTQIRALAQDLALLRNEISVLRGEGATLSDVPGPRGD